MYDTEQVITDLENAFKNNLNTEIGLINTEKGAVSGDVLFIEDIPNTTYLFQAISKSVNNYKVFLLYALLPNERLISAQSDNYIEPINITFEVCLPDKGDKSRKAQITKLLRYSRALRSVIIKNLDLLQGYGTVSVVDLTPSGFAFDRQVFLSGGIHVNTTITAR